MTLQIQKEALNRAVEIDMAGLAKVLAYAPAAAIMQRTYAGWARVEARRMVRALGEALALVTARVAREPGRRVYASEVRRRAKLDRVRVVDQVQAEAERGLTGDDREALAKADALEAQAAGIGVADRSGRVRRTAAERRHVGSLRAQALALRTGVDRGLARSAALSRGERRLKEAADLEALREGEGDVIEKRRGQAQVRLRTRDGLKLLHERGAFAPRDAAGVTRADQAAVVEAAHLLSVGLRYRDRYELAQASLKSCLDVSDRARTGPRNVWIEAGVAHRRAASANQVRRLEIAVATQLGEEALHVLRMVAGEARTVASLASGRRRAVRLTGLLRDALTVVGDRLEKGA